MLHTHPPFDLLYFLSHFKYLGIRTGYLESEIFLYLLVIGDIVVWDSHSFVGLQVLYFVFPEIESGSETGTGQTGEDSGH